LGIFIRVPSASSILACHTSSFLPYAAQT